MARSNTPSSILSFNGGLNTDTNKALRDGSSYLMAENFSTTPTDGTSVGARNNAKSNELDTTISFASGHRVVGYANVVRNTVYFTTDGTDSNIYYHTEGIGTELKYSDAASTAKLNFSLDPKYRINAVGRQELSDLEKVYWVDGLNEFRYIDLSRDYTGLEATVFNSVPEVDIDFDIETSLVEGGTYKAGVVQYAVQFYNKNGAASVISELSIPAKLAESEGGSEADADVNKSVNVAISNINQATLDAFDRYRLFAVYYTTLGAEPTVGVVSEFELFSGDTEIVDTGEYLYTLQLEEFLTYKESTYIANAIETKNNILFLGDITESTFTSDAIENWDSRAYRFDSSQEARAYDDNKIANIGDGIYYYDVQSNGNWEYIYDDTTGQVVQDSGTNWEIPETANVLNRYNNVYNYPQGTRNTSYPYKYTKDGTTLGGEGLNVKYTFEPHARKIDQAYTNAYQVLPTKGEFFYENIASITPSSPGRELIEVQAGEVYRIGIKFYNKKGQGSFVKWVGDVCWENSFDYSNSLFEGGTVTDKKVYKGSDGIYSQTAVLQVDILNFPVDDEIVGWQVVRAKREDNDRSIAASGLINNLHKWASGEDYLRPYTYHDGSTNDSYRAGVDLQMLQTGTFPSGEGHTMYKDLFQFISPEVMFNNPEKISFDDYNLEVGNVLTNVNLRSRVNTHVFAEVKHTELKDSVAKQSVRVSDTVWVKGDQHAQDETPNAYKNIGDYLYLNQTRTDNSPAEDEYASSCSSVVLNTSSIFAYDASEAINNNFYYASLVRDVDLTRYGGYTYEQRFNTEYVPFSKIQGIADTTAYGTYGDSWTSMYYLMHYLLQDNSDSGKESVQTLLTFPVQSKIDTRYRLDLILDYITFYNGYLSNAQSMHPLETVEEGILYQPTAYDEDIGDLYRYNNVYSQTGEYKRSFVKPFDFRDNTKNATKVIASEEKINGESIDQWTNFLVNNFIEVDTAYGSITELKTVDNNLFFWQERAFGALAVNDRSLITDASGAQLSLGTGGVLERYDYASRHVGNADKYNIATSENAIFWTYSPKNQICIFDSQLKELSVSSGIATYMEDKGTIIDPITVVDTKNYDVLFKLNDEVLVFDLLSNNFGGVYTFEPAWFIKSFDGNFKSSADGETFYTHNSDSYPRATYYGTTYPSTIKHLCSEGYPVTKTFDTMRWESESTGQVIVPAPDEFDYKCTQVTTTNSSQSNDVQLFKFEFDQDIINGEDYNVSMEVRVLLKSGLSDYDKFKVDRFGTVVSQYNLGTTGDWQSISFNYTGVSNSVETILVGVGNSSQAYQVTNGDIFEVRNLTVTKLSDSSTLTYTLQDPFFPSRNSYAYGDTEESISGYINIYDDTFSRYRFYNDYQNTDWQDINWKRKERSFTSTVPRDRVNAPQINNVDIFDSSNLDSTQTYKRRMRDKYVILDMEYDNTSGNKFSVPYIIINYRQSTR